MNRRIAMLASLMSMTPSVCMAWDRYFELNWDEEVQLHDGSVIWVQIKHTYERVSAGFTRYGGVIVHRDTTLTFDSGKYGVIEQLFRGFVPKLLDKHNDSWYSVLDGGYYTHSRDQPGQDWGKQERPYGQLAIKLKNGKWTPIPMSDLPDKFQRPNLLLINGDVSELAAFDFRRVTLIDKRNWLLKHPLSYVDVGLGRPPAKRSSGK